MYGFDTHHCQAWPINLPCDSFSSISLSIFANWCWCRRWPYSHVLLINTAPPPFGNLAWLHRMGGSLVFFSPHPSCTHNTNKMKNVVILPRLDIDTKSRDNKEKKKKRNYIKLKTFDTAKETINKMIKQPIEWKKLLVNHISDKGLISKIYKELIRLNNSNSKKKTKQNKNKKIIKHRWRI